jgi:hypothetical protein
MDAFGGAFFGEFSDLLERTQWPCRDKEEWVLKGQQGTQLGAFNQI